MILTNRDKLILKETYRFHGVLARQIKLIGNFKGKSGVYRRIKILVDNGYLKKKKYIYGLPSIYTVTTKGLKEINIKSKIPKIRLSQLEHDLLVVDVYLYLQRKLNINLKDFITEYELRKNNRFKYEGHKPDLVFQNSCAEVEISLKNETRLKNNIENNYLLYKKQYWILDEAKKSILNKILKYKEIIPNIEIIFLEEVSHFDK